MLSSAKIGRGSWRYYQDTVARGACEYYAERGDAPGRWHGAGLAELGLEADGPVLERRLGRCSPAACTRPPVRRWGGRGGRTRSPGTT